MPHTEGIYTQEKLNRLNIPLESLQLQGGNGRLFCSNCKETDVTFSLFHWQRLISSKWYWAGSTAPELNLASAITLFPFICAREIKPRVVLFAFFNYRTSHIIEQAIKLGSRIERKTMLRVRTSLFPPSVSSKMKQT